MLAECRSEPLSPHSADLNSVPGLIEALNNLTEDLGTSVPVELKNQFDLSLYQKHITSHLTTQPTELADIPPIIEDQRLDLIWKFIAAIFLDHAGLVNLSQQGRAIWVIKIDDRERQDISGNTEEADGLEGPPCGTQTW